MKDTFNIPPKPTSGVWGDEDVYKAYVDLLNELENLIPEHRVGLHLRGTASKCKAKGKMIVSKARILDEMIRATCIK